MLTKLACIKENETYFDGNDDDAADLDLNSIMDEFHMCCRLNTEKIDKLRKLKVAQQSIKCRLVFIGRTYHNNGLVIKISSGHTYEIDVICMGKTTNFKNMSLGRSKGFVRGFFNFHHGHIKSSWCIL
jgi:hypothetical protein